jgi:hypothetical protein
VDQARYEELKRKRRTEGLNDREANELGRMMAERAGKPYSNADQRDGMPDEERLAG